MNSVPSELQRFERIETIWPNPGFSDAPAYYLVWNKNKCGLWSCLVNRFLLTCSYDSIKPLYEKASSKVSLFQVSNGRNHYVSGIYDAINELFVVDVREATVEPVYSADEVVAYVVRIMNRMGILNREGDVICPIEFNSWCFIAPPNNAFYDGELMGPYQQQTVLSYKYKNYLGEQLEKVFFALAKDEKYYLFDIHGERVFEQGFQRIEMIRSRLHEHNYCGDIYNARDTYFKVTSCFGIGLLSEYGSEIFPCMYDGLDYLPSMDIIVLKKDGIYQIHDMSIRH